MRHFEWIPPRASGDMRLRLKQGLLEGVVPLLVQLLILALAIFEFVWIAGENNGSALIQSARIVDGEASNPNLARFIYMLLALLLSIILCRQAKRLGKRGKVLPSFWLGVTGGVFLWQAIGECSWHFGVKTANGFISVPHIEGPAGGLALLVIACILAFAFLRGHIRWGSGIFMLSFMSNWIGHFALKGTFPLFAHHFTEIQWFAIGGLMFGIPVILLALYLLFFAARNLKGRLISSIVLYTGLATLALGLMGG